MRQLIATIAGHVIALFARIVTAPRVIWDGCDPVRRQRVYFANHTSNADFILVWTVLPPPLRRATRPVAAADYWLINPLRRFIGEKVFNAVLIDRNPETRTDDPVAQMVEALDTGVSLLIFPEGTRNVTDDPLLPFRTGLFHLAGARPNVDLVPVWIDNLNSVLPKGEVVPVPLICTVRFGAPIHLETGETKDAFLTRAEAALLSLSGAEERAA